MQTIRLCHKLNWHSLKTSGSGIIFKLFNHKFIFNFFSVFWNLSFSCPCFYVILSVPLVNIILFPDNIEKWINKWFWSRSRAGRFRQRGVSGTSICWFFNGLKLFASRVYFWVIGLSHREERSNHIQFVYYFICFSLWAQFVKLR